MKKIWFTLPFLAAAVVFGCEADEFKDAPSARAPQGTASSSAPAAPEDSRPPSAGPVSGTSLPPGHPPIGDLQGGAAPPMPAPGAAPAAGGNDPAQFGKTGPLRWEAPESWRAVRPSNEMRLAQYIVDGGDGAEPAEMTVFFFGPGGGGGVEANLERWASQFSGGPAASRDVIEQNGIKIHTIDATGTYDPGMAMGGTGKKDGQRMLGAIAETPSGAFFFRLIGPEAVTTAQSEAFATFLASFRLEG